MIVPKYYENLHILHENTLPNRSYYIPASCSRDDLVDHRENSDRFQLLSGQWQFRYYESIYQLKEQFFALNYDASGFDLLPVPSVWQMHGYDHHHYINSRYPFPADPPYVPHDNPCGAYIHSFTYHTDPSAPRAYLNFEGVDSCYYVWLNGKYIGYSQVAHSISEFDVTDFLRDGENKLAVLVLKWCDGSYLECQDKFRWSGIFRDVYLLRRPQAHLWDYFIHADISGKISVELETSVEGTPVSLTVYDPQNNAVATAETSERNVQLTVREPLLWNAETPNLYKIVLSVPGETVVDHIGFRKIWVENSVVYINGAPVKFYGVNRHESNPQTGYVVDMDQMNRELTLLKAHNFNGIRTSHYPSHPVFYQLCDRYGFYVIDEADIEAHGAEHCWHDGKLSSSIKWNVMVADDPEFTDSIVDRVQRLVHRDKNRPSAVIWSMGNESAYGCCFEAALAWTKSFDPSRLTHYESALYVNTDRKYDFSNLDLYSRMYGSLEDMQAYIDRDPDKPFIQCEYCHAMGNGPGDLEDYFQMFNSDPRFCGGFVWEFCDHAVYKGVAENGKPIYFYGGDHDELVHDGNFCMDGLVYPDRTPHTGMLEFKNVHRPARAQYDQASGTLTLTNYLAFTDLKDYLDISYTVTCDGAVIASGRAGETPSVLPGKSGTMTLAVNVPSAGNCWLKISYSLKQATRFLNAGHDLGFDEFLLTNADSRNQEAVKLSTLGCGAPLTVSECDEWVKIHSETFTYTYSKRTGLWHSLHVNGKDLLERPMELNIWRAPTDNDRKIKLPWQLAKHHVAYARAYASVIAEENGTIIIKNTMSVGGMTTRPVVRIAAVWTVESSGRISLKMDCHKDPNYGMLPRFGLRLFLPKAVSGVSYYGVGPYESYPDKHHAGWHGRFEAVVSDLHEDYLRPQENGSHLDCSFVTVAGEGMTFSAVSDNGFSFNASHYTQEELTAKNHSYELEESPWTVLCLDYAHNGIGSNSCGPVLADKYALTGPDFTFEITLIPRNDTMQ